MRELREERHLSAMDICRRLQMAGWDVSPPRYTQIEKQRRSLSDLELRMILRTLKASWSDLE
ncbi:MAG: helix-turn-helix transcriptional regulator [Verrucomicrobia bacterium]|nr:helix-turn-helix transcriptional regulator [Verrucomicrobiota bacterium]